MVGLFRKSGKTAGEVSRDLGLTETSVRAWIRQAEIDEGNGPAGALTTAEREEFTALKRENKTLRLERDILKSDGLLRQGEHVKFAFISAEKAWAPVSALCRVLEVTRSGFYAWQARDPSDQAIDDQKLALEVAAIYKASGETYGSPRVHAELHAKGLEVSRKRVARMMRELGLRSRRRRRFKATTDSKHTLPVAENVLDRKFDVDAPDVAWVTDITYVWTDEGWLYLAAILDLFSRRVVGHAMSERIDRALVLEALRDAVGRRVPDAGLLHHSDRGSQYASNDYQDALTERGITCSMSRKGNCWDSEYIGVCHGTAA